MKEGELIAMQEDFDRIYRDFSKDLGDYIRSMEGNVKKVYQLISDLRDVWVSEDREKFEKHATDGMEDVTAGLETGKKLREQMDQMERELSEYIKALKTEYKQ